MGFFGWASHGCLLLITVSWNSLWVSHTGLCRVICTRFCSKLVLTVVHNICPQHERSQGMGVYKN